MEDTEIVNLKVYRENLHYQVPGAEDIIGVRDVRVSLGASDRQGSLRDVQAAAASVAKTRIRSVLAVMKEVGLVREHRDSRFELVRSDASEAGREDVARQYRERREADKARLERMTMYAQSTTCRWRLLLEYFGDAEGFERCGSSDNCVDPPELRYEPPSSSRVAPVLV